MPFDSAGSVDDDTLIARFAAGDQSAARVLTLRILPGVLALARRMLNDPAEAEDVAQDAMMRLWKIAPDWQPGRAKPSTWAHTVASNLCIDRLRRRRTLPLDAAPEPIDTSPSADARLMADDRAQALNQAMAALPERQRMAVHLRHIEGHTNMDIAEIMDITVEAVEGLIGRGKRSLAETLRHKHKELGLP